MADILIGVWHGGNSYSHSWAEDAEEFDSVGHAMTAMRDRRNSGAVWKMDFRYIFKPRESAYVPAVDDSSFMDLFRFSEYVTPEEISERINSGEMWRRLEFGPRGGIVTRNA